MLCEVEIEVRDVTETELKRIKELETENSKLKRLYAKMAPESAAIKEALSRKRQMIELLVLDHELPVQCSCRVVGLPRKANYRVPAGRATRCRAHRDANCAGGEASTLGILELLITGPGSTGCGARSATDSRPKWLQNPAAGQYPVWLKRDRII